MKKHLSLAGAYLLVLEASFWIGLLVATLGKYIAQLAFSANFGTVIVISAVFAVIASVSALIIGSRTIGYKKRPETKEILIALLIAFAVQQILAPIFQYIFYVAGATTAYFADWVLYKFGDAISSDGVPTEDLPGLYSHLIMTGGYLVLYAPSMYFGTVLGKKRRENERKSMTENDNNENKTEG